MDTHYEKGDFTKWMRHTLLLFERQEFFQLY